MYATLSLLKFPSVTLKFPFGGNWAGVEASLKATCSLGEGLPIAFPLNRSQHFTDFFFKVAGFLKTNIVCCEELLTANGLQTVSVI